MLTCSSKKRNIIFEVIREVLIDHEINADIEIITEQKLGDDLGFTSLMFAQLIMTLQDRIELDPFADEQNGASISDMVTVENLLQAYSEII